MLKRGFRTHVQRPLIVAAAVAGIAVLTMPLAVSTVLDALRWYRVLEQPSADTIWIDPDWRQMPYAHWQLRGAQWQETRTAVPGTAEQIAVSTTSYAGHEFWTVTAQGESE